MPRYVEVWQFRCPECGFGHHELGHLLHDEEIYCMVCEDETGRHVKLLRWVTKEAAADPPARDAGPAD